MDTLGYAKRLRDAGIPPQQAEAHAEAARDFVMAELVTKSDLQAALQATRSDLQASLQVIKSDLQSAVQLLEAKIDAKTEALTLRLTVRLGGLLAAGIAILSAIVKLT